MTENIRPSESADRSPSGDYEGKPVIIHGHVRVIGSKSQFDYYDDTTAKLVRAGFLGKYLAECNSCSWRTDHWTSAD